MSNWHGGLLDWIENDTAYLSVVFSWQMQKAYQKAVWYKTQGYNVVAGGPAVYYRPHILEDVATVTHWNRDVVSMHNSDATFTSRGCIRNCKFCIVHKIETEYEELKNFPIRPIVCDNNFLASSDAHFNHVIDKLKPLKSIDFNQGLDARLLTKKKAEKLRELNLQYVRLSWDHIGIEKAWMKAFQNLISVGFKPRNIYSFVLIGFDDTPDDAYYRLQTIKDLGAITFAMRYQPLDIDKRNQYVNQNWTERELRHFSRYWNRQLQGLKGVSFKEYKYANYQWESNGKQPKNIIVEDLCKSR